MLLFMETNKATKEAIFGSRLQKARQRRGLTQGDVIERLGKMNYELTQPALSHYEQGRRYPDPPLMKLLAEIIETSLDYLTGATETDAPVAEIEEELAAASGAAKINRLMERLPKDQQQQVITFAEYLLFRNGGSFAASTVIQKLPPDIDISSARSESNQRAVRAVLAVMRRHMKQDEINDVIDEVLEVAPQLSDLIARGRSASESTGV